MTDTEQITNSEFGALLDLFMVSDPYPLEESEQDTIRHLLDREAGKRGFSGWIEAYHDGPQDAHIGEDGYECPTYGAVYDELNSNGHCPWCGRVVHTDDERGDGA